ncbi:pentatricopeptide [Salmonella enterica]|nr:pentatricopeptide [Salmonella enterica]EBS0656511.1 pentatricopeptide [Salmonella enterica subsp. enterica serovar Kintambo]EDT2775399.1 pentatricopeptide [Salmonella enterica subsp. enterica]EAP9183736.1 pentatricopeptide [Salmonella enterica]EAU3388604.1 pentatricopeptide [Salmonella enterica]
MNKANTIKLSFFNKYERVHRRNVKIKPEVKYKELEEHLINYTSFLSKIFQTAADGFCRAENTNELKSVFNELNAHRGNINIMTKNLSIACGKNQEITFNEYFSF